MNTSEREVTREKPADDRSARRDEEAAWARSGAAAQSREEN